MFYNREKKNSHKTQTQIKNPKKIIFLNLADEGGLGDKSVKALMKKHSIENEQVILINLLSAACAYQKQNIFVETDMLIKFKQLMKNITPGSYKIMLAVHGKLECIDNCYFENKCNELALLFSNKQLARFFNEVLLYADVNKDIFHFSLIMCYAARSNDIKKVLSDYNNQDIETSFAYHFFQKFTDINKNCQKISMTARTGAVCFNEETGKSEVVSYNGEQIEKNELPILQLEFDQAYASYNQHETNENMIKYNKIAEHFELAQDELNMQKQQKYGRILFQVVKNGQVQAKFKTINDTKEPLRQKYTCQMFAERNVEINIVQNKFGSNESSNNKDDKDTGNCTIF